MRLTVLCLMGSLMFGTATQAAGNKLADFVEVAQPKRGRAYAVRMAQIIRNESNQVGIAADLVAVTAYIETEFRHIGRDGIMQITGGTYRWKYRNSGLSRSSLKDNVRLGALELKRLRSNNTSKLADRGSLRSMWGRYNGSGANGKYSRKAMLVLQRYRSGNKHTWKKHISKHHVLWRG